MGHNLGSVSGTADEVNMRLAILGSISSNEHLAPFLV